MPKTVLRIANRFEIHAQDDNAHLIGQGGMGTVYLGLDTLSQTQVAIKALKADRVFDSDMVQRFIREGQVLRQLNHPNIVKLLDAVEQDGVNYLIMEYVAGGSLRHLMDMTPRMEPRKVVQIGLDIADALTRAHRLNILHRDIKPDNVLLAEDGTPRLTDFGMARIGGAPHLTQDGAVLGTLAYMSPEAFNGETVDERSDIWAFGVMLYEMLIGERPFKHAEIGALITAILTQPPQRLEDLRPDLPVALVDLVERMLTKDVQARIGSARLIGAELEAILRGNQFVNLSSTLSTPVPALRLDSSSSMPPPTLQFNTLPSIKTRATPNNLPTPPTPFVGRERELDELSRLLSDPQQRLLSLVGPGGIGKTRIALTLARQHLEAFPDGVYCASLAACESLLQALMAIAEALNFSFGNAREPQQELFDYLREKRMLLLLENFENIPSAANLLADLLQAAPQVKAVVTSRERLRLRGEQVYEVNPMRQPPEGETDLEALLNLPSVLLFQHSARRIQPDFYVGADNAQAVAAIVRAVEGLPLAIELAATWLESLPVEEIAQEIERSIDFLETDLRDVPERQRSIRAVFAYAWSRLSQEEQAIFARLTLFQGGFERDAAEKVGGASLRLLNSLINKSLIQRDAKGRYSVQKLLRQYVAEQAEPRLLQEGRTAHARYYAAWIGQLQAIFNTPQERQALDHIELEVENLRMAWQTAIDQQLWEISEAMLTGLWLYKLGRSLYREGVDLFDLLISALEGLGLTSAPLYWRIIAMRHLMSGRLGGYEEALRAAQQAYAVFAQGSNPADQALALNLAAYSQMMLGQVVESRDTSALAVEVLGDMVDPTMWYMAMANYGYAEYLLGNYEQARILYESILHTAENLPCSPITLAYSKNNLGEIVREQGDYTQAQRFFQAAHDEFSAQHNRRGMAFSLNNLAGLIFYSGDYAKAEKMYQRAYQLHREIGDRPGMGHSLAALGNAAMSRGDIGRAREYFEQALALRRSLNDQRGIADSLMDLGRNALDGEDYVRSERLQREAIAIMQQIGYQEGLGDAYASLAFVMGLSDRIEEALPYIEEARRIGQTIQNPMVLMQAETALAQYWVRMGRFEEAEALIYDNLERPQVAQIPTFAIFNLVTLAQIDLARGQYRRALEIVSSVILYRSFVRVIHDLALSVLDELRETLPAQEIEDALEQSRTISLESALARVRSWRP